MTEVAYRMELMWEVRCKSTIVVRDRRKTWIMVWEGKNSPMWPDQVVPSVYNWGNLLYLKTTKKKIVVVLWFNSLKKSMHEKQIFRNLVMDKIIGDSFMSKYKTVECMFGSYIKWIIIFSFLFSSFPHCKQRLTTSLSQVPDTNISLHTHTAQVTFSVLFASRKKQHASTKDEDVNDMKSVIPAWRP